MSADQRTIYRFGEFQLDAQRLLLLSAVDGKVVPLTPRVLDTLLFLVERRGELVDKRTLLDAIWPNVVVEENNLTQAISTLRRALGERPQDRRYIATVPGRGYRFVADVAVAVAANGHGEQGSTADDGAEEKREVRPGSVRSRIRATPLLAVIALLVIGGGLVLLQSTTQDHRQYSDALRLTTQQLVSTFPGNHTQPTLSPDASMVAFVNDASGIPQIWVKNLERGDPIRITDMEDGATSPAWSPRNDQILFDSPGGGIWSVGTLGSPAPYRIIEDGLNPAFSFDGRTITYEFDQEIRLANADGSAQRSVQGVPKRQWSSVRAFPALSPDGRQIAFFLQEVGPRGDIWIIPASGGEARRLTFDSREAGRPVWTPDGHSVLFASKRSGTGTLWRVPLDGEPEPVTSGVGDYADPVMARNGGRLLYTHARIESRFIVTDPDTGRQETIYQSRNLSWFPKISPNGRHIAYFSDLESGIDLFVMNTGGTGIRRLTFGEGEGNIMPRWSADGQSIYYYENLLSGTLRRIAIDGGPHETILREFRWESNMDLEWSPRGDAIVFIRVDSVTGARRAVIRHVESGHETLLDPALLFAPSWSQDGQRVLGTNLHQVVLCPANGAECKVIADGGEEYLRKLADDRQSLTLGHYAQWSTDQSRIFFARRTDDPQSLELWLVDRQGRDARPLFKYGPVYDLAGRFQVLPGDRILWNRYHRGKTELWLAEVAE